MSSKQHIAEAEAFRAKHGLSLAIPAEEISEVMGLAELNLLPKLCPGCANGECYASMCWGQGCTCSCEQAKARREGRA